jgi:hypothetical protein
MKSAIIKIDRALKSIYNLEVSHKAEDFLLKKSPNGSETSALFVKSPENSNEMSVGIYLSPDVKQNLLDFSLWSKPWSTPQLSAFSVATEEVSHFLYLLHHSEKGRAVSQWEMELQGEIDKFILAFFAQLSEEKTKIELFDRLFDSFFSNYQWAPHLSSTEQTRYEDASVCAREFIKHLRAYLKEKIHSQALTLLRSHYRWNTAKKMENFWEKI